LHKPELVMPAGTLEKLKTAFIFGADAVYIGGRQFSLRSQAGNFTIEEIEQGLQFARLHRGKVYVAVNVLARNDELSTIPPYLEDLCQLGVNGLIISDPGVLRLAMRYAPGVPVTVSTQVSISNYEAAAFYRDQGAKRLVLARELSLPEIEKIKRRVGIEIEVFIHGAMCMAYSGRCLLSHYMTGRSANQGACAHPCRYRYALVEEKRPGQYYPIEQDQHGSYILNSRDLCLLDYIPRLAAMGIDAFKVEGRMKSPLYIASVASVYRQAIDAVAAEPDHKFTERQRENWMRELNCTATRPFTTGFMGGESARLQDIHKETSLDKCEFCGVVRGWHARTSCLEVEQRANFGPGDRLELLIPGGEMIKVELTALFDQEGNRLDRARHARQTVFIPFEGDIPPFSILRRVGLDESL